MPATSLFWNKRQKFSQKFYNPLLSHLMGQDCVTWTLQAARQAGKCFLSSSRQERKNGTGSRNQVSPKQEERDKGRPCFWISVAGTAATSWF
jgi:hypothetical protein